VHATTSVLTTATGRCESRLELPRVVISPRSERAVAAPRKAAAVRTWGLGLVVEPARDGDGSRGPSDSGALTRRGTENPIIQTPRLVNPTTLPGIGPLECSKIQVSITL